MRATLTTLTILLATAPVVRAQGTVLQLSNEDQQTITQVLGAGVVGAALPRSSITDA